MKVGIKHIMLLMLMSVLTLSCTEQIDPSGQSIPDGDPILIGGVEANLTANVTSATKATEPETVNAETIDWLIKPLKTGLNITYGLVGQESTTSKVAILKLLGGTVNDDVIDTENGVAKYSFMYYDEPEKQAIWYNNGFHFFQGLYVPTELRYSEPATQSSAEDLIVDQSDDISPESNYTLLNHYLSMPANTRLYATVERIMLPFRHRLAHVIAYILIDPVLDTHIEGYSNVATAPEFRDDPSSTEIHFNNVQVLSGVKESAGTLTPTWTEARQVVPHFYGQKASMTVYESKKEVVYETSENYAEVAAAYDKDPVNCGYTRTIYTNVPSYDLIVRPTYTSEDNVMYDEEGFNNKSTRATLASLSNKIDFEITLHNGLVYDKTFEFDLDANYETAVYLRISRERVDYNESDATTWVDTRSTDGWYGVNNEDGHYLSKVGSSWQRAYMIGSDSDSVSDGHIYGQDTEDDGQYMDADTWISHFVKAYEGGADHGNYFVLTQNITIDAELLPDNFVFTGHLDAFDPVNKVYRTITLTNLGTKSALFAGLNGNYTTAQELDGSLPRNQWEANVYYQKNTWIPYKNASSGWRAEVLNLTVNGGKLFEDGSVVSGNVQNCKENGTVAVTNTTPAIPVFK